MRKRRKEGRRIRGRRREKKKAQTHRGIGALAQLLELLERTGVSLVHLGDALAAAEAADADGRVGAVVEREGADVGGHKTGVRRVAVGVARVPEDGAGCRQLGSNVER